MGTAVRRHVAAGVALMGAGTIAVAPIEPPTPPALQVANLETRLVNSVANIPTNLVYALANVPYNTVEAVNHVAASLFFSGPWFNASSTNIWGEDSGDPPHFESLANLFIPFPAFSNTLGHQLFMITAAAIPAHEACAAETCYPVTPTDPITGITVVDQVLNFFAVVAGLRENALIDTWLKVSFSDLMAGYTFPRLVNPNGEVHSAQYGNYCFEGTIPDPETGEPLMAWSEQTWTWEPLQPFEDFYDSLTATPPPFEEAIQIPSIDHIIRAFQALSASLVVAFNPYIPGSPFCAEQCNLPDDLNLTSTDIVGYIEAAYPGNEMINQWLQDVEDGTANGPTDEQIAKGIENLQVGAFTFDPATTEKINATLAEVHPLLPSIAVNVGLLQGYRENPETGELEQYGGWRPHALTNDIIKLFDPDFSPEAGTSSEPAPSDSVDVLAQGLDKSLAARARLADDQTAQPNRATSIPALTADSVTMDVQASETPVSQLAKKVDDAVQQDVQSLTRAVTEGPVDAAAVGIDADSKDGQTTGSVTKPGEKSKPTTSTAGGDQAGGKSGGRHRKPSTGLAGAVKSVNDRISSSVLRVTDRNKSEQSDTPEKSGTPQKSGKAAKSNSGE